VFDLAAPTYDEVGVPWFGPIAQGLVDALAPRPGEIVLDVGCGKGAATFLLAERVVPQGRVVGLDASAGMLERARLLAEQRGVAGIDWMLGDAAAPGLPSASVDVVASSLVLFFLPEPVAALRAWREVLAPEGRLGVTTFGSFAPAIDALSALLQPYLPGGGLDPSAPAQPSAFDSDAGVEEMLTDAGFTDLTTRHLEVTVRLRDVQHWRTWSQSLG
jgi:ubiquinone/menaquinone biosynthesis C-methylase UbiE